MAYNQYPIDTSKQWGNQLRRFRNMLLEVNELGVELLGKAAATVDGANYSQFEAEFGIPTGKGVGLYGEFNSVMGKLTTDASVTNVKASIKQFCDFAG